MQFRENKKCHSRKILKKSSRVTFKLIGIRSESILKQIPMHRTLPHLLLGLGNNAHSKCKDYVRKRIEKLSHNEIAAQNMPLLGEIKLDDTIIAHDDLKKEIPAAAHHRSIVISRLKSKSISKEDQKELEVIRKPSRTKIDENKAIFNNLEKSLATAKKEFNQFEAAISL